MLHRQLLGVLALLTAMVVAAGVGSAATGGDPVRGYLSEVRGGGLAHDVGVFGRSEEDGVDVNVELLFVSPDFLKPIWAPRPHIGASISTSGETSQAYFGLTWGWDVFGPLFLEASFGGSVHNGETTSNEPGVKELGCSILFRESVAVGYRFNARHNVSLMLDHISNGTLCDANEGLDNVGIRYGYRF